MSWEYYLVPRPEGSRFSEQALAEMRAFWDAYPTYTRSDGVIAVCRDFEYRDWVLRSGVQDEPTANVEVVGIGPEKVAIGFYGWLEMVEALVAFMRFCQSHWSCDLIDERRQVISADDFRKSIYLLNDERPPDE